MVKAVAFQLESEVYDVDKTRGIKNGGILAKTPDLKKSRSLDLVVGWL